MSIWKNCPNALLNDLGLGRYVFEDFFGVLNETQVTTVELMQGEFSVDADTGAVYSGVLPANQTGGVLDVQTGVTDNDAVGVFQQIAPGFVLDSDIKVWFECRFSVGDVADDMGIFVGMIEETELSREAVAANGTSIGAGSGFGFSIASGDPDDLMAVWNLDAGTGTVVLQDITAAAIYYNQADVDSASLVTGTYYKVGLYFDGRDKLSFFLNGYKVADLTLVAGTHPTDVEMGPIACIRTGDGEAESFNLDWIRYAHQEAG
jgi:hypothetical protein